MPSGKSQKREFQIQVDGLPRVTLRAPVIGRNDEEVNTKPVGESRLVRDHEFTMFNVRTIKWPGIDSSMDE